MCWIAPNSSYRAKPKYVRSLKRHFEKFKVIQLTSNLRNTKEIVKKSKNIAETQLYEYAQGVSETPSNFPKGNPPKHTSSFGEAIFQAKMNTDKGLLLVADSIDFSIPSNERAKFFHSSQHDFENDNPCNFLHAKGNILVTSRNYISGFEWPVVIYENDNRTVEEVLEHHECNVSMRCTTQLYIVGSNYGSNETFYHSEIRQLLQSLPADSKILAYFKDHASKYITVHASKYKIDHRDFLRNIEPILEVAVKALQKFDVDSFAFDKLFDILESFFKFILDNVLQKKSSKLWLFKHVQLLLIKYDFIQCEGKEQVNITLQKYIDLKLLLNTIREFNTKTLLESVSKLYNENQFQFWKEFEENVNLPSSLKNLTVLQISIYDSDSLISFKINVTQYLIDHKDFYPQSKLLDKIKPDLENSLRTIEISESDGTNDFLRCVILDIAEIESLNDVEMIANEVINKIKLSGSPEEFLNFNRLHRTMKNNYYAP